MSLSDALQIILTALAACVATEVVSWLLVYRTSSYKRVRDELDKASKKLETFKQTSSVAGKQANKGNKKERRLEENMKTSSRDLTAMRFKLGFIMSAALLVVFNVVSNAWDGHVIAKLPFSPPGFLQRISHRGLMGNDPTDCSAIFVYALALGYFKANVAKLTGWGPSRAATRLMQAQNAFNPDKYK